jgi:hypothetical protein
MSLRLLNPSSILAKSRNQNDAFARLSGSLREKRAIQRILPESNGR